MGKMIKITKHENKITIEGHAGFAPQGQDIVCAGVSALFLSMILSSDELTCDETSCELSPGSSWFRYESLSEELDLLVRSFFIGVRNIADAYPECVAVSVYESNGTGSERVGTKERKEI
mgnify:FL=1